MLLAEPETALLTWSWIWSGETGLAFSKSSSGGPYTCCSSVSGVSFIGLLAELPIEERMLESATGACMPLEFASAAPLACMGSKISFCRRSRQQPVMAKMRRKRFTKRMKCECAVQISLLCETGGPFPVTLLA